MQGGPYRVGHIWEATFGFHIGYATSDRPHYLGRTELAVAIDSVRGKWEIRLKKMICMDGKTG